MDQVKFFNEDLKDLFNNQPFEVAKNLEGDVFREYENRVTKRFEFHQRTYFIKKE